MRCVAGEGGTRRDVASELKGLAEEGTWIMLEVSASVLASVRRRLDRQTYPTSSLDWTGEFSVLGYQQFFNRISSTSSII